MALSICQVNKMPLSNLHGFHRRLRLQNATAFSSAHYLAADNGICVNPRMVQLSRIQSARRVILAQEPVLLSPARMALENKSYPAPEQPVPSVGVDMTPDDNLHKSPPLLKQKQGTIDTTYITYTTDIIDTNNTIYVTDISDTNKPDPTDASAAGTALLTAEATIEAGLMQQPLTETETKPEMETEVVAPASKHLKMMDNHPDSARIPVLSERQTIDWNPSGLSPAPKVLAKRGTSQRKASRVTWQLGRGTIEKVDKLTGEIVHLVELP